DLDADGLETDGPEEQKPVRSRLRQHRSVCLAGQLPPEPARPQPSAIADCSSSPACTGAHSECFRARELDYPRLARDLAPATTSSVGTESRRLRSDQHSVACVVSERHTARAAGQGFCDQLTSLSWFRGVWSRGVRVAS